MENLGIYALGFLGQALFGARLILQWWQSERKGEVVSPVIYWKFSLIGSYIFLLYGMIRIDPVIIIGQFISYYIYIRNLQLKNSWQAMPFFARIIFQLLPIVSIVVFSQALEPIDAFSGDTLLHPIMILGTIGQLALNLRFVYQWYYSEKRKTSLLPYGFWAISTWASVLVIIYSLFHPIYGWDPVLLVSQSLGIVVYIRNMILFKRQRILEIDVQ